MQAEKLRKPTWRSAIQEDVDYAISHSMTMKQFYQNLEKLGYEIKYGKHIAVRPPTKKRFVRLRSLTGDDHYTEESIKALILTNSIIKWDSIQDDTKTPHYHYMYKMRILPKNAPNKKRLHFLLKKNSRYMDCITKETTLLCKKKINHWLI